LRKQNIKKYRFERYSRIDENLFSNLTPALKSTIKALVDCKVKDIEPITDDVLDMAETDANILTELRKFNWSYKI